MGGVTENGSEVGSTLRWSSGDDLLEWVVVAEIRIMRKHQTGEDEGKWALTRAQPGGKELNVGGDLKSVQCG